MHMIFVSTYNYWSTFQVFAYAPKIAEQLFLYMLIDELMSILCAEGDVNVVFNE